MMRKPLQILVSGAAGVAFANFIAGLRGDKYPESFWVVMLMISVALWIFMGIDIWARAKYWDLVGIPFSAAVSTLFGFALSAGEDSLCLTICSAILVVLLLAVSVRCPMDAQMAREWAEAKEKRKRKQQRSAKSDGSVE